MAPSQPAESVLPPAAREFFLLLGRAETVVCQNCPEDEEEIEIFRAKVSAYEAALRTRLRQWDDLPESTAERHRSRIENLGQSLEQILSERRRAPAEVEIEP
eukprot:CAMPEP_0197659474 /NCGR_PEP_ID=MMETSP1338-20131121/47827_1 /TAXON_ID=43686 ORGANISM="Pelagodinium beii, Strain RCC1491" /NCGR_SAMPLE_ID=MMETSP1338 /ASSEMBLY_ACC=CAM_ASM_000754 /LENGTH=101 /DNA_ID=CAMNT_0043236413 /DNA_START=22 /DNA_END=323 /DNA_ORIENTATION=+